MTLALEAQESQTRRRRTRAVAVIAAAAFTASGLTAADLFKDSARKGQEVAVLRVHDKISQVPLHTLSKGIVDQGFTMGENPDANTLGLVYSRGLSNALIDSSPIKSRFPSRKYGFGFLITKDKSGLELTGVIFNKQTNRVDYMGTYKAFKYPELLDITAQENGINYELRFSSIEKFTGEVSVSYSVMDAHSSADSIAV